MKTFEELHADTIQHIKDYNLCTSVYERYDAGELVEKWEKVNGVWKDITKKALLEKEIEEAESEITKYKVALKLNRSASWKK